MSTATPPTPKAVKPAGAQPGGAGPYRFTVEDYHRMGQTGVLHPDSRVELINGEILNMSPIGKSHASVVDRLAHLLMSRLKSGGIVRVQNPILLTDRSEPQPDFTIVKPRDDFYADAKPGPADVLWLIEIADTTLDHDRGVKLPLYARAGIPEAWIVDLQNRVIEIHADPQPSGDYGGKRTCRADQRAAPAAFPDLVLGFNDIAGHIKP